MRVYVILLLFLNQLAFSPTLYESYLSKYEFCKEVKEIKKVKKITKNKSSFIEEYYFICKIVSDKYNIPLEIILAQAILESNHGKSELSRVGNNFFGIRKGKNYVHYKNKYDSFHAYGKVLQNERYKFLYNYKNVEDWAYGLKKAGYAEDPQYPIKLIKTIK